MNYTTTITIPSTRIHLGDLPSDDAKSLFLTFTGFNTMKECAYNRLYEERFLKAGKWGASPSIKKEMARRWTDVKVPGYYVTSVYSTATGMVKSQKNMR